MRKNLRNIIRGIIVTLVIALAAPVSGCSSDGLDKIFRYDISSNPDTLDPQQSNDSVCDLIISNMFMGLFRKNADGTVSGGVCESYDVSDDGLVYNFSLRNDVYWLAEDFEKPCTAEDFVFGFRRLFMKETEAPRAKDYFCVKNAEYILNSQDPDMERLGVKAKGEYELEITLSSPNPRFLSMLSDSPAMPCCEEFFLKSRGKYGLSAECTPSNGAFWLKSWYYDPYADESTDVNHLILGRNYKNADAFEICPSGLNFFIEDAENLVDDFRLGEISCAAFSNREKAYIGGNYACEKYPSVTCGLVFNRDYELFSSREFRKALSLTANRKEISEGLSEFFSNDASEAYEPAYSVVPRQVTLLGMNFREFAGSSKEFDRDLKTAAELFEKVRGTLPSKLFTGARIIVPDEVSAEAVSYIMQEWQREFGFYCVVEKLSEKEYSSRLKSGDYEIAVLRLSGKYDSPAAYLGQFAEKSPDNISGCSNTYFDLLLEYAETASGADRSAELYAEAERILLDDASFVPLYYENEFFFKQKGVEDIFFDPFTKIVDFSLGKKK